MRLFILMTLLLAVAVRGQAQGSPTQTPRTEPTTLRAQAKLVVVDVVVIDRERRPVRNLKQQDFILSESKSPQTISSFEEHRAPAATDAAKLSPALRLPRGVFTNFSAAPAGSAVNILLLDTLNTPLQDQAYVRSQLLQYLKSARPGIPVAIFGLTTRLLMLQGFTSDPDILKSAVLKQSGKASPLLDNALSSAATADSASDLNAAGGGRMSPEVVANLQTFMDRQASFQLMQRAKYTLDAMNALARFLTSIPGRKNLLWFSGSFPLDVLPDAENGASDPFAGVASSETEYRETVDLLARSQVAVYPIDARGLMTSPNMSAANAGTKYARNPAALGRDESALFQQNAGEHATMERMATDTGGRAFFNTNGLSQAVSKAIDEGSNYYTLTYSPTNTKWKGDFRRIEVKVLQPGYTLAYRHGYSADDPATGVSPLTTAAGPGIDAAGTHQDPAQMVKAMAHGVPGATQILFKVRVLPVSTASEETVAPGNVINAPNQTIVHGPFRRYGVDFAVLPLDISYTLTPDAIRHGVVEFVTVVYPPDGLLANRTSETIRLQLTPEQFAASVKGGLLFHQEISVPMKGDFTIRTGVHDMRNNNIGATELPVSSIVQLPPAH